MPSMQTVTPSIQKAHAMDDEFIGTTEVGSGEMSRMVLGIFERNFPEPEFKIDVEPKNAAVNASLVRMEDGAEYKLAYTFQNFQDKPCKITVHAYHTA